MILNIFHSFGNTDYFAEMSPHWRPDYIYIKLSSMLFSTTVYLNRIRADILAAPKSRTSSTGLR